MIAWPWRPNEAEAPLRRWLSLARNLRNACRIDLLDPRWQSKIVKRNPDYSGTVFTATFALSRDLGWSYFEKLARQKVVQNGDAPKMPTSLSAFLFPFGAPPRTVRRASDIGRSASPATGTGSRSAFGLRIAG